MSDRFDSVPPSPFRRLADLIGDQKPGCDPIVMTVGEPGHSIPDFVIDIIKQHQADFRKYPPGDGTPMVREAIANWLTRRFNLKNAIDPDKHVLPLCGTREGLFSIPLIVVPLDAGKQKPKVIIPNPFYHSYAGAAVAAGAEPHFVTADKETGFLPDLDDLSAETLQATACFFLCTPANPQGAIADIDYLKKAILLARKHDFTLLVDECYSEIYDRIKPSGALEAAIELGQGFDNILVFNSLSKRSNLAGLRVGLCAGDETLIARFLKYRNLGAPQIPLPHLAAAAVTWADEAHVIANRKLYRNKIDIAENILKGRFGFYRPPGGFFLWLDVAELGGGEKAALKFWSEAGVKALPGGYLSRTGSNGKNPGENYIRIALVQSETTTQEALERIANA
jgi:aspartate/methionine/tyrosine aminotransferase